MTSPSVGSKPVNAPDYHLGAVLPHVKRAAELAGPMFGISTILGWRATAVDMAGHPAGLALDFMCDVPTGKSLNAWLHANAAALGLKYTIHTQTYYPVGDAPEPMADRGSPTQNHEDHVHAQFKLTGGDGSTIGPGKRVASFDDGSDWSIFSWLPGYQPGEQLGDGSTEGPEVAWLAGVSRLGLQLVAVGTAATLVVIGIKTLANGDKQQ